MSKTALNEKMVSFGFPYLKEKDKNPKIRFKLQRLQLLCFIKRAFTNTTLALLHNQEDGMIKSFKFYLKNKKMKIEI